MNVVSLMTHSYDVLRDVTCRVEEGSLTAVVGSVGSGKSSLLAALLGEKIDDPVQRLVGAVGVQRRQA